MRLQNAAFSVFALWKKLAPNPRPQPPTPPHAAAAPQNMGHKKKQPRKCTLPLRIPLPSAMCRSRCAHGARKRVAPPFTYSAWSSATAPAERHSRMARGTGSGKRRKREQRRTSARLKQNRSAALKRRVKMNDVGVTMTQTMRYLPIIAAGIMTVSLCARNNCKRRLVRS